MVLVDKIFSMTEKRREFRKEKEKSKKKKSKGHLTQIVMKNQM